jgi:hypothetical protein
MGQISEDIGIRRSFNKGLDHVATTSAQHIGGNSGKFDISPF